MQDYDCPACEHLQLYADGMTEEPLDGEPGGDPAVASFGLIYPLHDTGFHYHWPDNGYEGPLWVVTRGLAVGMFTAW